MITPQPLVAPLLSAETAKLDASALAVMSCAQHAAADARSAEMGVSLDALMARAGAAVAKITQDLAPEGPVTVVCGPGGNGGDGYVAAKLLADGGRDVRVQAGAAPPNNMAAGRACAAWSGPVDRLDPERLADALREGVVVDALYGAGLSRPLEGVDAQSALVMRAGRARVVSVDCPSGTPGDAASSGPASTSSTAAAAARTVTFLAFKPAHLIQPHRAACGDVYLFDIGHPAAAQSAAAALEPELSCNAPALWAPRYPWPQIEAHKHQRGRLGVVTGPGAGVTGAARLAAAAGLRVGAGLVTLLCPPGALLVAAAASTAVMTRALRSLDDVVREAAGLHAVVIGPAAGVGEETAARTAALLAGPPRCVLDADALTSFEAAPDRLWALTRPDDIATPHAGEFARLFPDLDPARLGRLEAARAAARRAGCVVILKGASSVVAAPDGRAVVSINAAPFLATAGSGDVLAGLAGGLLAQGMSGFDAACAAVWLHAETGRVFGPGLIADDLCATLPNTLRALYDARPEAKA